MLIGIVGEAHDVSQCGVVGADDEVGTFFRHRQRRGAVVAVVLYAAAQFVVGHGRGRRVTHAVVGFGVNLAQVDVEILAGGHGIVAVVGLPALQGAMAVEPLHVEDALLLVNAHAAQLVDHPLIDGIGHPEDFCGVGHPDVGAVVLDMRVLNDWLLAHCGHHAAAADDVHHLRLVAAVTARQRGPLAALRLHLAGGLGVADGELHAEEVFLAQQLALHLHVLFDGGMYTVGHVLVDVLDEPPDGHHAHIDHLDVRGQLVVGVVVDGLAPLLNALGREGGLAVELVVAQQTGKRRLVAALGVDGQLTVLNPREAVLLALLLLLLAFAQELLGGQLVVVARVLVTPHVIAELDVELGTEEGFDDDVRAPDVDERIDHGNVFRIGQHQVVHGVAKTRCQQALNATSVRVEQRAVV